MNITNLHTLDKTCYYKLSACIKSFLYTDVILQQAVIHFIQSTIKLII